MRRKIAKRKRRELLRRGAVITSEKWLKDPGWRRKDYCFCVYFTYKDWNCACPDYDELEAYKTALEMADLRDSEDG